MVISLIVLAGITSLAAYAVLAHRHRGDPASRRCYLALWAVAFVHLLLALLAGE